MLAAALVCALQPEPAPLWAPFVVLPLCLLRWPGRVLLGAALCAIVWTSLDMHQRLEQRWPAARSGEVVRFSGHVSGLVEHDPFRARFVLERDRAPARIRLSWYEPAFALRAGDCLSVAAKLDTPRGSANPGAFDYEAWLWREGIDATGYIKSIEVCDRSRRWSIDRLRAVADQRLRVLLGDAPMRGIIAALTLGARDGISDEQWAVLRATGTSHLVAISGLHIGLIAGWTFLLARWLSLRLLPARLALHVAAPVALAVALGYALLAGLALPTQRALVMVATALLAFALMRRIAPSRLLAFAALAVWAWSPVSVLAPGFWMSFGAVTALLWLARTGPRARLAHIAWLQFGLLLALAPLTLWFFDQASMIAPLVNALLVPMAVFAIPVILLATALALFWPSAGAPLLTWVAQIMATGWPGLAWLAQWPLAAVDLVLPGAVAFGLSLLAAGVLAAPTGMGWRWLAALLVLPAVIGWQPAGQAIASGAFRLTLLDVGQGLAVVVRTRDHTLVYDAGPRYRTGFDAGEAFVVPYLRHVRRTRVDRLVLSHGDLDHAGGADAVERLVDVRQRIGSAGAIPCDAGDRWAWDGVVFTFLYPRDADRAGARASNTTSCVLRVEGTGASALLTGDIEAASEAVLVDRHASALEADVLVVAHHGSASSTTQAFVNAVSPRLALISARWNNRWGFPDAQVLARLERAGAAVANTATDGAIELHLGPAGAIEIQRWRERSPRVWHTP